MIESQLKTKRLATEKTARKKWRALLHCIAVSDMYSDRNAKKATPMHGDVKNRKKEEPTMKLIQVNFLERWQLPSAFVEGGGMQNCSDNIGVKAEGVL
jgi:hypothetical protein